MKNICTNIIRVTFFEDEEQTSQELFKELSKRCQYIDYDINAIGGVIREYKIASKLLAPLDYFQWLCYKFNIDIIGVAYDFENGHVESYELRNTDDELTESDFEESLLNEILDEPDDDFIDEDLEKKD